MLTSPTKLPGAQLVEAESSSWRKSLRSTATARTIAMAASSTVWQEVAAGQLTVAVAGRFRAPLRAPRAAPLPPAPPEQAPAPQRSAGRRRCPPGLVEDQHPERRSAGASRFSRVISSRAFAAGCNRTLSSPLDRLPHFPVNVGRKAIAQPRRHLSCAGLPAGRAHKCRNSHGLLQRRHVSSLPGRPWLDCVCRSGGPCMRSWRVLGSRWAGR